MSTLFSPLIFSKTNVIPDATITTTTTPLINNIDDIKNHYYDAKVPIWDSPTPSSVVINGNWTAQQIISYFAIIGHNIPASAKVKVEMFNSQNQAGVKIWENTADADGELVTTYIPLGLWAYGVDPYGGRMIQAFPVPVIFNFDLLPLKPLSFRLTINDITAAGTPPNFQIKTLMAGDKYQLDYNFEHGSPFRSHTDGEITRSKGGKHSYSVAPQPGRILSLRTSQLTEGDRLQIETQKALFPADPFLIQTYPGETNINYAQQSFVAIHEQSPVMSHAFLSLHASEYTFLEV